MINCPTQLHLVGHFYKICIMMRLRLLYAVILTIDVNTPRQKNGCLCLLGVFMCLVAFREEYNKIYRI